MAILGAPWWRFLAIFQVSGGDNRLLDLATLSYIANASGSLKELHEDKTVEGLMCFW